MQAVTMDLDHLSLFWFLCSYVAAKTGNQQFYDSLQELYNHETDDNP